MTRIDNFIDIKAPKDKVFAYVAAVENQAEWVKWAKSVEVTSAERGAVGATDAMRIQVGPSRSNVEGIVTELKPGHTIARRVTRGMEWTERMSVLPLAEGTKFVWSVEYKPPMGPIGAVMDLLFMSMAMRQLMEDSLVILKSKMEAR